MPVRLACLPVAMLGPGRYGSAKARLMHAGAAQEGGGAGFARRPDPCAYPLSA